MCPRAGSPAPGAGSEGRGRGQRKKPGPASPRPGGSPTRGSLAPRPGFYSSAAGVGCGAGRWVPPLRVLPLAGTSSEAEHRSGLGAWRWARGAGRGRRRSQSEQRPAPTPRSRRRGPPSSSRSSLTWKSGRAGGSGVHILGQGWHPAGEDALTHSGQLHPFGQSRIGWWWVVGR